MIGPYERKIIEEFSKTDFARRICRERRDPGDFANFGGVISIMRDFIAHTETRRKETRWSATSTVMMTKVTRLGSLTSWTFHHRPLGTLRSKLAIPVRLRNSAGLKSRLNSMVRWYDITERPAPIHITKGFRYILTLRAVPNEESARLRRRPTFYVGCTPAYTYQRPYAGGSRTAGHPVAGGGAYGAGGVYPVLERPISRFPGEHGRLRNLCSQHSRRTDTI